MTTLTIELINGLKVGLEHISFADDPEDELAGVVVVDLLLLRVSFISYK